MSTFTSRFLLFVALSAFSLCSGHVAPVFIDNVSPNCNTIDSSCFVTPPDNHVFWGKPGDQVKFVVGMYQFNPLDQSSHDRNVFFEINSTFYNSGAVAVGMQGLSIPTASQIATTNEWYREFTARLDNFAPSNDLRVCFRALVDCNPNDQKTCPVSQVMYSGEKQVLGRQTCCILNPDGSYNDDFYPRRCVNLYVAVPPQIVSITPTDENVCSAKHNVLPTKSWEKVLTYCDLTVQNGQMLRLNIDAVDPNLEDDVDIQVMNIPSGAFLGPRMCCDENFTMCHPLRLNSTTCTSECVNPCFSEAAANYGFDPKCGSSCTTHCVRNPCRFVRRQLMYQPTSDQSKAEVILSDIKISATDDSARLGAQKSGLCCAATNLTSNVQGLTLTLQYNKPALIEPLPPTRLPDAYVNCPIHAFGVHAFFVQAKNFSDLQIVPEGCAANSYTLAEGCPDQSLCTVCLPTSTCTNAQCKFPLGMDIGSNLPYIWKPYDFRANAENISLGYDVPSYYIVDAYYNHISGSQITFTVYSNIVPANGTVMVIGGVQPSSPSMAQVSCLLNDRVGLSTQWVGGVLRIILNLEKATGLTPLQGLNVSCHFQQPFTLLSPHVSYDSSRVGGLKFSMAPVPLTQCATNCGVHAFGNGTNGVAVYRMIRWTPKKGQEGKDYSLCFRAVDTRNTSGVPLVKCFYIRVVKCKYCALPGDSYTSLAKLYFTDWFQIWSSNPNLGGNPDAIAPGSLVNLGGLYAPPAPIQISQLAFEMATTEKSLRNANPEIPVDAMWVNTNQEVCILPGVCDSFVAPDGSSM